jgi:hypothetical protein
MYPCSSAHRRFREVFIDESLYRLSLKESVLQRSARQCRTQSARRRFLEESGDALRDIALNRLALEAEAEYLFNLREI